MIGIIFYGTGVFLGLIFTIVSAIQKKQFFFCSDLIWTCAFAVNLMQQIWGLKR